MYMCVCVCVRACVDNQYESVRRAVKYTGRPNLITNGHENIVEYSRTKFCFSMDKWLLSSRIRRPEREVDPSPV